MSISNSSEQSRSHWGFMMSRWYCVLGLLVVVSCRPAAPRFAVSEVRISKSTSGSKVEQIYSYQYKDGALFSGRELDASSMRFVANSGNSTQMDLRFDYSEGRLTEVNRDSPDDSQDQRARYMYTSQGNLLKMTVDTHDGGDTQLDFELSYDDSGRAIQLSYEWEWLFIDLDERADISYDDNGFIRDLDGGDVFVRYSWQDGLLERCEVQRQNSQSEDYNLEYNEGRLSRIRWDDASWSISYDEAQRIKRIDIETDAYDESIEYSYTDGNTQGVRVAPRLPLYLNWVFALDGKPLPELDLLTLPDYFD